jgi:ectoine hydroxylase-related dioxygenase (phytanoyl-CoA dioxygenase family)
MPTVLPGALDADLCRRWCRAFDPPRPGPRPATGWPVPAAAVLAALARSPVAAALRGALGPAPLCRLDFSHARHGRPAHSWHQDGALRHDFLAHAGRPAPAAALLVMRTVWIPLTPCGDAAPSLQWVLADTPALLLPAALDDAAVAAAFGLHNRRHACLAPGDALLFDGALLHRTHLQAAMAQPRTSLELRFFPAGGLHPRLGPGPTLAL